MKMLQKAVKSGLTVLILLAVTACSSSLVIQKVNFSQPVETVLNPDSKGIVHDRAQGLDFSIMPLQYAETQDTSSVTTEKVRLIRDKEGYYFITANGYKNVYVMKPQAGEMKLHKKIHVSDEGIMHPAFNQREPNVQLIDRGNNATYSLNENGIKKEDLSS